MNQLNRFLLQKPTVALFFCFAFSSGVQAQGSQDLNLTYQRPPEPMARLIEAPFTPSVMLNSKADWMLVVERPGYPTIEEVAAPEIRIAGLRINPAVNGSSRVSYINNIK